MVHVKRKFNKCRTGTSFKRSRYATMKKTKLAKLLKEIRARRKKIGLHTLFSDKVVSSVEALLKLKALKRSGNEVLLGESQPIYLTVQCVRIPKMQSKNLRFSLPHPVINEDSDVCLFVPDLKKGKCVDHEPTVEHYKELLKTNQIRGISEIIPLRQLKVEYDQYELRRQLLSRFDLFLSDGRISGHVLHLLGKEAYRRRKLSVPVDMRAKNLKLEFERARHKVLMMMKGTGDKASLKIGHTDQSAKHIAENILEVARDLGLHYPGGWKNVYSLHIHFQDSKLIPVYVSLKPRNEVEVPVVKYIAPKKAIPVEGELSTFPGTKVIVMPDGEVIVKKEKSKEDEEMGSDWEEYNSEEELNLNDEENLGIQTSKDKTVPDVKMENLPKKKADSETEEDDEEEKEEEEEESEVDEKTSKDAENAYLNEWHKERISQMESKCKAEENKEEALIKPNNKKNSKRNAIKEESMQEIPAKKIKKLQISQKANKKEMIEEAKNCNSEAGLKEQRVETKLVQVSDKKSSNFPIKKSITENLEERKKQKLDLKYKKSSGKTKVALKLHKCANKKM